ncbi:MAG: hypothetical protein EBR82_78735, partial [Caulobacteraceae bacterium]|nr:hypothetical protein [Caulobacteraceae bacterium]
ESEAVKKELSERTWKLGKALTPYARMVEAGYSLATGTRPEMFLDEKTPLTTGETIGRLFGLSPARQASYFEMKEAPDLAKRILGMQPDIPGIPRERGETDKTYRVKVQRVTEWRNSYGKQLENHPRFKTLDKTTKDKALEIINGNISAEAAKIKPNLSNLQPAYVIRRAKESIRQAPRRARRQMYVPPPED